MTDQSAQSLGVRSNLLVAQGVSITEQHEDRIILRMPDEPYNWGGNMLYFKGDEIRAEQHVARFKKDFPTMAHIALSWDVSDMTIGPDHKGLSDLGFELEQLDILTLTGPLNRSEAPEGIIIRPVTSEANWEQVIQLQLDVGEEQGYERSSFEHFIRGRFKARQKQIRDGWAIWLGAFDGDLLVADLGIYADPVVARFQDVETRKSHRKQGICAALVTAGVDWAKSKEPGTIPVLQALSDGPAGRVYRRCGFEHKETQVLAILPPQGMYERPEE
jgi:GNAT superfamily N-acetyltransferase